MRFTFARRTAAVGAALLSALVVAAATAGGASAAGGTSSTTAPTWSSLQLYGTLTATSLSTPTGSAALLTSVACSSFGNCVAAGVVESASGSGPAVAVESGGQWGQPVAAPVPSNAAAGSGAFNSVSCSSATACVAVGAYTTNATAAIGQQALAVPFTVSGSSATFGAPQQVALPAGALATTSQIAILSGVSCAATCTAVGAYENGSDILTAMTATEGAGVTWNASPVTAPAAAASDTVLNAISCPSSGSCEAVGTYGDGSGDLKSWVVQVSGGLAATAVPVTIPGDTAMASAPEPDSGGLSLHAGLNAVSCPSAGVCTAAGSYESSSGTAGAVLLPIAQGAPGQISTLGAGLTGIWCQDGGDCVAAGVESSMIDSAVPIVAEETGGAWSQPVTLQTPDSTAEGSIVVPEGLACTSPGVCVTTGFEFTETVSGATTTLTEGSFFAYSAPPLTVTTSSLPAATVGKPYKATLQSIGGSPGSSSWSVSQGSLPAGLTLDAATGVISGTPAASGQSGFTVTVTNAGPPSLSSAANLSITVGAVASVRIAYTRVSGNTATLVLGCADARCAGALKLTGVEHLRGKRPTAVAARAKQKVRKRTITLARGRYSVKAGATHVIKVKLNRGGVKLLKKLGKISGRLTLTPSGSKKPALIRTLTFRAGKKHKR